jgi:hypothetical protein
VGTGEMEAAGTAPDRVTKPPKGMDRDRPVRPDDAERANAPPSRDEADRSGHSSNTAVGRTDSDKSGQGNWSLILIEGVTALMAAAAFILSLYNLMEANRTPEMDITMPTYLRLTKYKTESTLVIQPTFTIRKTSNLTGVISTVRLEVEPQGNVSPHFRWDDVIRYVDDNKGTHYLNWLYVADPAPIIVTPDRPRNDHLRFLSDEGLPVGTWTIHLIAERVGEKPLEESFCLTLTVKDVQTMKDNMGGYLNFRNDFRPDELVRAGAADCYRFVNS